MPSGRIPLRTRLGSRRLRAGRRPVASAPPRGGWYTASGSRLARGLKTEARGRAVKRLPSRGRPHAAVETWPPARRTAQERGGVHAASCQGLVIATNSARSPAEDERRAQPRRPGSQDSRPRPRPAASRWGPGHRRFDPAQRCGVTSEIGGVHRAHRAIGGSNPLSPTQQNRRSAALSLPTVVTTFAPTGGLGTQLGTHLLGNRLVQALAAPSTASAAPSSIRAVTCV
jgi:hypothetical protein